MGRAPSVPSYPLGNLALLRPYHDLNSMIAEKRPRNRFLLALVVLAMLGSTGGLALGPNLASPLPSPVDFHFASSLAPVAEADYLGLVGLPQAPPSTALRDQVVVTLPLRNTAALDAFDEAVSDPSSPLFDHFLTAQQEAARFYPTAAQTGLVEAYLQSQGLSVVAVSSDGTTITASGSLGAVGSAFHTSFSNVRVGANTYFRPDGAPLVPSNVAPDVLAVAGLSDRPAPVSDQLLPVPTRPTSAIAGFGVQDYPMNMHQIYQLDELYNATGAAGDPHPTYAQGVTITQGLWSGIPLECAYSLTDLNDFFNLSMGYSSALPKPISQPHFNVPGYPGNAPGTGSCQTSDPESPAVELTVDQEYSGTDAPGANLDPTWVNGTGPAALDAQLEAMVDWVTAPGDIPGLDVFTQSFGGGESNATSGSFQAVLDQDYAAASARGVTVLASSGDDDGSEGLLGEEGTCPEPGTAGVDYPGSSPYLLAVGGTANMQVGATAVADAGSTVWNWCGESDGEDLGGSTGGVSYSYPEQPFQYGPYVNASMTYAIGVTDASGCPEYCGAAYSATSARPVPDVSGPASQDAIFYQGGWDTGYGGTSFSSPAVAGLIAEIVAFDGHTLGMVAPSIYQFDQEYLDHDPAVPVPATYMVQNYSNSFFNAAPDYNTSTGWGIPMALNLAELLGKPWITASAGTSAQAGTSFPVSAEVRDDRPITSVAVSYQVGSGAWANTSLALASGSTTDGTWSGAISLPGSSSAGVLHYCVDAFDDAGGNSWTPFNESAWAETGGADLSWGCTTPQSVGISPSALHTVTATEKGLPSGATWYLNLSGPLSESLSSNTARITADLSSGNYSYTVATSDKGYAPAVASGTLPVKTSSVKLSVTFDKVKSKPSSTVPRELPPTEASPKAFPPPLPATVASSTWMARPSRPLS